jgi:hypothetical protein
MPAAELHLYDIAFLAGGPDRVVDTALVVLVCAGKVRIHSPGHLATADLVRRHPVEAAVLDAVGPTGHRSVDTVRWRLRDDDRLLDVGRRLREAGLLGRTGAALRILRGDRRALARTRAGSRTLRALREQSATGDPEMLRVALGGRAAMTDAAGRNLRAPRDGADPPAARPPVAGHRPQRSTAGRLPHGRARCRGRRLRPLRGPRPLGPRLSHRPAYPPPPPATAQ